MAGHNGSSSSSGLPHNATQTADIRSGMNMVPCGMYLPQPLMQIRQHIVKHPKFSSAMQNTVQAIHALHECATAIPAEPRDNESDNDWEEDEEPVSSVPRFIQKLKALVDDPDIDGVAWTADGRHISMPEPHQLTSQLAKYFKNSTKLKSFVRQLHFYGFKKTGGSRSLNWIYSHKHFQRDGQNIRKVRRKTCSTDRQMQLLRRKVDYLHSSLSSTQSKLKTAASALASLLEEKMTMMKDHGFVVPDANNK